MGSLLCTALVLLICGAALVETRRRNRQRGKSRKAGHGIAGWVVGHEESQFAGRTSFKPIVAFHDHNGIERRFPAGLASDHTDPPIGSEVSVLYVPGKQEGILLDSPQVRRADRRNFRMLAFACAVLTAVLILSVVIRYLTDDASTIMPVLLVAGGILGIAASTQRVLHLRRLSRYGTLAEGHVYGLDESRGSSSALIYNPLVLFRDDMGVEHRFRSNLGSTVINNPVGGKVSILFPSGRPELAELNTMHYKTWSIVLPAGVGLSFLLAATYALTSLLE